MSVALQLLLVFLILLASFLITFAAIQVFQILHEVRMLVRKMNLIVSNTQTISDSAAKPITAVNQFFSEVSQMVKDTKSEMVAATPDRVIDFQEESKPSKRFFHRSGQQLRPN